MQQEYSYDESSHQQDESCSTEVAVVFHPDRPADHNQSESFETKSANSRGGSGGTRVSRKERSSQRHRRLAQEKSVSPHVTNFPNEAATTGSCNPSDSQQQTRGDSALKHQFRGQIAKLNSGKGTVGCSSTPLHMKQTLSSQ